MTRPLWNAAKTLVVASILGTSVAFASQWGAIEGKLFPVATAYVVTAEVPAVGIDGVEVSLEFSKVRDCHFELQEGYVEPSPGRWKDVPVYDPRRVGPAFSRPKNRYEVTWLFGYGPSLIGAPLKLILHHKCWGQGLWETITEVNIPARTYN